LKQVGDRVERDEPLVEIMTDKVNAEIPAIASGVLRHISVREGETVPVGTEIALLDEAEAPAPPPAPHEPTEVKAVPPAASIAPPAETSSAAGRERMPEEPESVRTSPLVRRLAREHQVDLTHIQGSGINGRVTKDDVLAHVAARSGAGAASAAPAAAAPSAERPAEAARGPIKLSPLRRMIAEHMVRSKTTVPHATTFVEVDMTALVRRRAEIKAEFQRREGVDLTYLPYVVQATAEALQAFPTMNAEWTEDEIVLKHDVNVGVAVAMEEGLVVPVVHRAERLSIAGLARKIRELSDRARAGKLSLDDVRGGTFTVNNPGAFGTVLSLPIINAPQAAILT